MPVGNVSVTATSFAALVDPFGLIISICKVTGAPPLMLKPEKDLLIPITKLVLDRLAVTAETFVRPSAEVIPPTGIVFVQGPPAVVLTSKVRRQLAPAARVAPVIPTDVAPAFAVIVADPAQVVRALGRSATTNAFAPVGSGLDTERLVRADDPTLFRVIDSDEFPLRPVLVGEKAAAAVMPLVTVNVRVLATVLDWL